MKICPPKTQNTRKKSVLNHVFSGQLTIQNLKSKIVKLLHTPHRNGVTLRWIAKAKDIAVLRFDTAANGDCLVVDVSAGRSPKVRAGTVALNPVKFRFAVANLSKAGNLKFQTRTSALF